MIVLHLLILLNHPQITTLSRFDAIMLPIAVVGCVLNTFCCAIFIRKQSSKAVGLMHGVKLLNAFDLLFNFAGVLDGTIRNFLAPVVYPHMTQLGCSQISCDEIAPFSLLFL